jgi:hypothetical protein
MTYVNAFCLTIKGISSRVFLFFLCIFCLCRFQKKLLRNVFFHLYVKSSGADLDVIIILDMSSDSVGLLSSPDRSNSPLLTDHIVNDCVTTSQIFHDYTGSILQPRSPGKRQLTIEESLFTTNDPKRLCNR